MNMQEVIARINALAKKSKEAGLSPEEIQERDKLRRIYIDSVKANLVGQLKTPTSWGQTEKRRSWSTDNGASG